MTRSESLDALLPALIKARAAMPRIVKDQTANIESQRGRFSYAFADLSVVLEAVVPALCQHGLAIVQVPHVADGAAIVDTVLFHASGQFISADPLAMPIATGGAQAIGSAITYARRYSVLSILGLAAAGEDDDGATADAAARRSAPAPKAAAARQAAEPVRQAAHTPQTDPVATLPQGRVEPQAAGRPKPEVVAEARERLERAARRGTAMLRAQLTATPTVIRAAVGAGRIAELQHEAEQADDEVSPA